MKIWENGSDFHYISEYSGNIVAPWGDQGQFYFSGRPALNALSECLRDQGQARRIWMPSYYCDQVVYPILRRNFPCIYYDGDPYHGWVLEEEGFQAGDALLVNSFFGVDLLSLNVTRTLQERGIMVIEDHSQDPYSDLAWSSQADYAFASLRKTLPLPDGGVLWSPSNHHLPSSPSHIPEVSLARIAAMLAKRAYLNGEFHSKELFRSWYSESEAALDQSEICGMSVYSRNILRTFDVDRWREARASNHNILCESIDNEYVSILHKGKSHLSPMGFVLLAANEKDRDNLKRLLISSKIYPAVLWPLASDVPLLDRSKAREFAQRMLFLHCDGRYNGDDMLRIAEVVNTYVPTDILINDNCVSGDV